MLKLAVLFLSFIVLVNSESLIVSNIEVSWVPGQYRTQFVLKTALTDSNSWIGIGFGSKMQSVNSIICKNTDNFQLVENYYNNDYAYKSEPFNNPYAGFSNVEVKVENNFLYCSFTRENSLINDQTASSLDKSQYFNTNGPATQLIGAYGRCDKNTGKISYHANRGVSQGYAFLKLMNGQSTSDSLTSRSTCGTPIAKTIKNTENFFNNLFPRKNLKSLTMNGLENLDFLELSSKLNGLMGDFDLFDLSAKMNMLMKLKIEMEKILDKFDINIESIPLDDLKAMLSYFQEKMSSVEPKDIKRLVEKMWINIESMNIEMESLEAKNPQEIIKFYQELAIVQEFMSSVKPGNLKMAINSVPRQMFKNLMQCPKFIHLSSSLLKKDSNGHMFLF